ncbi:MAG TPA: hypothetical protein DCQ98_09005 [Planctomycetaceae bacterium]|nr:hypothetical protein [Planctomycetaceae bacterium]HRF02510.1 DUF58 domain-containing protein [Pirellulaceae bacterium]
MKGRRAITVTREGWYYLFILAFVVGGAVMRQINPLFALSGLMVAPLLLNWRIAAVQLRSMRVDRRLPPRIAAGESLAVDLSIRNDRSGLDTWQLRVIERIRWIGEKRSREDRVEVLVPIVAADHEVDTSYRTVLLRRGRYRFEPPIIGSAFPFGLIAASRRLDGDDQLLVSPRVGRLGPAWRRAVRADRTGAQGASYRRGAADGDFYSLREYRRGDPIRSIHWRSSAKLGELMVRQVEQRSDRQVALLVDLWIPETFDDQDLDAVELAASFAATAVVDLCRNAGGKLTLSIGAAETFHHSGSPSPALRNTVLDFLATAKASAESEPFSMWLEAGAGGGGGSTTTALVISTRPAEELTKLVEGLPEYVARIPRIGVRDPGIGDWFRLAAD